jgi:tripeptide aminopeptidase
MRDIVTSYAGIVPFCDDDYGRIFETAGALAGMPDWKMIPDGLSDAKVFAEFGIPSVNLSRLSTRTY